MQTLRAETSGDAALMIGFVRTPSAAGTLIGTAPTLWTPPSLDGDSSPPKTLLIHAVISALV